MILEKTQAYADGKYDVSSVPGAQIQSDYENKRTDAWEKIEELNITKRILSTRNSPLLSSSHFRCRELKTTMFHRENGRRAPPTRAPLLRRAHPEHVERVDLLRRLAPRRRLPQRLRGRIQESAASAARRRLALAEHDLRVDRVPAAALLRRRRRRRPPRVRGRGEARPAAAPAAQAEAVGRAGGAVRRRAVRFRRAGGRGPVLPPGRPDRDRRADGERGRLVDGPAERRAGRFPR
jgi:hypothetical protein